MKTSLWEKDGFESADAGLAPWTQHQNSVSFVVEWVAELREVQKARVEPAQKWPKTRNIDQYFTSPKPAHPDEARPTKKHCSVN